MSRHERDLPGGGQIVVGWDPPLSTFFAQVYNPEPAGLCSDPECELRYTMPMHHRSQCEDNPPVLWIGAMERISVLDELFLKLGSDYAARVKDLVGTLETDQAMNR